MVIHHFNRIIRNKWVWGVFAVLISMFFAFDFIFDGRSDTRGSDGAGKLGDFAEAFLETDCSAALAASLFHFKELSIREVKEYMQKNGISVRL